jgi:hypothetical protein
MTTQDILKELPLIDMIQGYFDRQKSKEASIYQCTNRDTDTLNIYVHGYSAIGHQKEIEAMMGKIAKIEGGDQWLFVWPSGFILDAFLDDLIPTLKPFIGNMGVKSSMATDFLSILLPLLSKKALDVINHFKHNQKQAEKFGAEHFFQLLGQTLADTGKSYQKINLIGHSLGARLIYHAMKNRSINQNYTPKQGFLIDHVICLGGAVSISEDWLSVLGGINGQLRNYYSENDLALTIKPDTERCIGQYPIVLGPKAKMKERDRLVNVKVQYAHTEYWLNIDRVMSELMI